MAHADPTFAAVAARIDRDRVSRETSPASVMPPLVGQRVTLPTGRDAVYDGVVHDPHDSTALHRLSYRNGDQVLLTYRGLLRVLAAAEQMGAAA